MKGPEERALEKRLGHLPDVKELKTETKTTTGKRSL
jgi:hypothetical protein